jgi:hypothetical protein
LAERNPKISNVRHRSCGWGQTYEYDEHVNGHVNEGSTDEHAEVLADIRNVEFEEVGQDQEEHSDGRQLDQERDDLHHNLLNLPDCS